MTIQELLEKINSYRKMPDYVEVPIEDFERLGNEVAAMSIRGIWLSAQIDRPNFICRGIPCVPGAEQ